MINTQYCQWCDKEVEDKAIPSMDGARQPYWVHHPGGHSICYPQQRNSPKAQPKEAAPELTREELQALVDEQGQDLYRAQDVLAFVGEMCDSADRDGTPVTTAQVRKWLAYTGCGGALVLPEDAQEQVRQVLGIPPVPELDFCHHPNVVRSSRQTMAAGRGLRTLHTASCPDCPASAESFAGEPALGPWLLNPPPSTAAPTEVRP